MWSLVRRLEIAPNNLFFFRGWIFALFISETDANGKCEPPDVNTDIKLKSNPHESHPSQPSELSKTLWKTDHREPASVLNNPSGKNKKTKNTKHQKTKKTKNQNTREPQDKETHIKKDFLDTEKRFFGHRSRLEHDFAVPFEAVVGVLEGGSF